MLPMLPEPRGAVFHPRYPGRQPFGQLRLPVVMFQPEEGPPYPALKAEGVPIETLRRCAGFRENRAAGVRD